MKRAAVDTDMTILLSRYFVCKITNEVKLSELPPSEAIVFCSHETNLMTQQLTKEQIQQQDELSRVCRHLGDNHIRKIILHLGNAAVLDPLSRCSMETLYLGCLATEKEKREWRLLSSEMQDVCKNHVRSMMVEVRKHIVIFYATSGIDGPYRLEFPPKPPPSPMKGHYAALFSRVEIDVTGLLGRVEPAQMRSATSLWSRMLASERPSKCLLVYPIAAIIREGSAERDTRGLFSGSGEIPAAFMIGTCVPHLRKRIEIRPTMDVTGPELRAASALIFLGSTVHNQVLTNWRDEMQEDERWPEQAFMTGEINGIGSITKVRGKNQRAYSYEVVSPRSHETDYALVSHFRDLDTSQSVIALQGISSPATAAAAEYLCTDHNAKTLQKRLGIDASEPVPCFELLLRVTLRNYVATHVEFVDLETSRKETGI